MCIHLNSHEQMTTSTCKWRSNLRPLIRIFSLMLYGMKYYFKSTIHRPAKAVVKEGSHCGWQNEWPFSNIFGGGHAIGPSNQDIGCHVASYDAHLT